MSSCQKIPEDVIDVCQDLWFCETLSNNVEKGGKNRWLIINMSRPSGRN